MTEIYAPEKMDPFRPARLLGALGNPHQGFPSIHVAGTKGKGSVSAMCATCLRAAGLSVGLYTSPHLQDLRERIRILTPGDAEGFIPREKFAALVEQLKPAVERIGGLTWFELVTAAAFMHFEQEAVDVAVVEVGLGGRLDATNVLSPLVSVITSLSLDHTGLLGDTIEAIAAEKGGIIKDGVPVVSAAQAPGATATLQEIAHRRKTSLTLVERDWQYEGRTRHEPQQACARQEVTITRAPAGSLVPAPCTFALALNGRHQQHNAVVSLAALSKVQDALPSLSLDALRQGLAAVSWPGRLQMLLEAPGLPSLLIDGAHNADSAEKLVAYFHEMCRFRNLWLVLGITADKNVPGILRPLLPLAEKAFITQAQHPRATEVASLQAAAADLGYQVQTEPDIARAVRAAWQAATPGDLICVTGSLYIVGDLLNCWDSLKSTLLQDR
ncbi:MAG: bifunctional folylpolyglutamate synthase/dihydrofolate synthase [Chloroflexota bacterium]